MPEPSVHPAVSHLAAVMRSSGVNVGVGDLLAAHRALAAVDAAQREAVRAVFAAQEPEAKEIRRSVAPRIAELRLRSADDVRRVLRPDQLEGFRRFMIRQEARARILDVPKDEGAPR